MRKASIEFIRMEVLRIKSIVPAGTAYRYPVFFVRRPAAAKRKTEHSEVNFAPTKIIAPRVLRTSNPEKHLPNQSKTKIVCENILFYLENCFICAIFA